MSYERLPMLEIVFDRLVRLMTTSLRNFTSDNVEVSLDNITSIRFGDYLNSIPLPAMLAVCHAEELGNYGLFTVDSNLIYSIVDVLLGGRRGTAAMRIEGRPYTTIERTLVQRMIEVILGDMRQAFEPLTPVTFTLDRLETNPRFAAISRPANAAILVKLRIDMEDRGGRIELMLPYATLEPIRKLLLQQFMGEKFGRDFDLGKPSGDRAVVHPRRDRRDPGRTAPAAEPDHEPASRPDHHARRRPGFADRIALRRRSAAQGPHGPHGQFGRRARRRRRAPRRNIRAVEAAMSFDLPLSMIIELTLAALLAATLVCCFSLERRLKRLRRIRRASTERSLRSTPAIVSASASVAKLREAAAEADKSLGGKVTSARALVDELSLLTAACERIATRMEGAQNWNAPARAEALRAVR